MTTHRSHFEKDVEKFREWLQTSAGLTSKSTSDCVSRCRRVEKELRIDLKNDVSNLNRFMELIKRIKEFTESQSDSYRSKYAFAATLKAACRKYACFKFPSKSKDYPKYLPKRRG